MTRLLAALRRILLLLLVSLVALEGTAHLAYLVHYRRLLSPGSARELRLEQIGQVPKAGAERRTPTTVLAAHPFVGFVFNPEFDRDGVARFHRMPVNEWGFLDDGPSIRPRRDDEVVIGIFGGSVAFWTSIHGVSVLLDELRQIPALHGKRPVVVRTALAGAKQPQQLATLAYLLTQGGHFDVVVNLDGVNESALPPVNNVAKGVFPAFPRDWAALLGEVDDVELRLIGEITYLRARRGSYAERLEQSWLRYSATANLLWRLWDERLGQQIVYAQVHRLERRPDSSQLTYAARGPAVRYGNETEMYAELVRMWAESSKQMARLSSANQIRYFHFLQPTAYLPGTKPMRAEERRIAVLPDGPYDRATRVAYPMMQEAGKRLEALGVRFVDLTGVFKDVESQVYVDNCCHVTLEGYALLGRAIGRVIRSSWSR